MTFAVACLQGTPQREWRPVIRDMVAAKIASEKRRLVFSIGNLDRRVERMQCKWVTDSDGKAVFAHQTGLAKHGVHEFDLGDGVAYMEVTLTLTPSSQAASSDQSQFRVRLLPSQTLQLFNCNLKTVTVTVTVKL